MKPPATELTQALARVAPGRALDLACGEGRHSIWLRDRGWEVTAVDREIGEISGVTCLRADLELREFAIEPGAWDLIVCWLYWQEDLLPLIAAGVRPGGVVALAGKTTGRFATGLTNYREVFGHWSEISSGEDTQRTFLIAAKPL